MPAPRAPKLLPCIAIALVSATLGCNIDNPGDAPSTRELYFPNALAISPAEDGRAPAYLFVANSNFDLRYNGGTVQALNLDELDALIDACGDDDCTIETRDVVEDSIEIGSFSTAMEVSHEGTHLLVTTRSDDGLTFIDVDHDASGDDVLDCGGRTRCGQVARRAAEEARAADRFEWPEEPSAIYSGSLADWASSDAEAARFADVQYVVVAHHGGASLFVEQPGNREEAFVPTASLDHILPEVTSIAYDPAGGLLHMSMFQLFASSLPKRLLRLGVAIGGTASDPDPLLSFLYDAGVVSLDGVAASNDTRDLVFVEPIAGSGVALSEGRALVVARQPSALLVVDVDEARNRPGRAQVKRVTELGAGPSRLVVGELDGIPMAFVSCFDMREIFIVDLVSGLARSVVPNLSGPFELALDAPRQRLYAADFRTSVIRVIDLAPIVNDSGEGATSARLVATIGRAKIVQELQ